MADDQRHDGVRVGVVSGGVFQVAGVSPVLGRLLDDRDEAAGARVAVVSHQLWLRLYARSPAVLGSTLYLDEAPFVIVGVVQAPFAGPSLASREAVWLPATAVYPDRNVYLQSATSILTRLPSTAERARLRSQAAAAVEQGTGRQLSVELHQAIRPLTFPSGERTVIPAVLALVAAVVFVALLNLAGFLVTLATARQREIGVRLTMGATHSRLVRQFLTESLLIAGVAGALGALAVHACVLLLVRLLDLPLGMAVEVDGRAYVFLAVAMLGMAVAAGLAPLRYAARLQVAADLSGDARRLRLAARPERLQGVEAPLRDGRAAKRIDNLVPAFRANPLDRGSARRTQYGGTQPTDISRINRRQYRSRPASTPAPRTRPPARTAPESGWSARRPRQAVPYTTGREQSACT